MPLLSDVARRIRPAVFSTLQARIDRLPPGELIPLHIGDTHLAPPEKARRVLASYDGDDSSLHRYGATVGLPELRAAMAKKVGVESDILIGNGGTHVLYCAAQAVLGAGDEVVLASPYWPLAPGVFTATGAIPVDAPIDSIASAITEKTRALYIISPNNPDGRVLTDAELEHIAALARKHDLWVFSDEVYSDVVFDGVKAASIANLEGMRERTITLHSLSKSHALAGLRIGYATAPAEVVAAGRRVSTHTAFNISVAMQRAALAALEDTEFPKRAAEVYRAARDASIEALEGSGLRFHRAEGATYLFLDFAPVLKESDATMYPILERAVDRGVLLAPGEAFGTGYERYARLCTTSVPLDRVREGIARLRAAIADYRRST